MPIDQRAIEAEVLGGLKNEAGHLDERRLNALYYEGEFGDDVESWGFPEESVRTSLVMRRVVDILTANLYRSGPARSIPEHEAATRFLEEQYRRNQVDALWQEADRLSMVNEVAAFEVYGNIGEDSEERPLGFNLWGGEQLVVWSDPDNARTAGAVATIDKHDCRRRLRLWTAEELVTFATDKAGPGQTAGGTAYREVDRIANPYGCIPFAFVHTRFPARDFWSGGPGCYLRKLNYHVNYRLCRSATDIDNNRPMRVAEGVPTGWNFPEKPKPGQTIRIPVDADAAENANASGRLLYITCDLGYLGSDWQDLAGYLEHGLEMLGVPYSALRMEQLQAASGISLVAEQIPIVLWAQARQRPFTGYERCLARVAMKVAAGHARANRRTFLPGATVAQLEAAAKAELSLRYPEMSIELPGPQRDQADGWLLDRALTSRVLVLMKREGLTREEARRRLEEIAEDREFEQGLLTPKQLATPRPGATPDDPPTPGSGSGEQPDDDPSEDQPDERDEPDQPDEA